MPSLLLPPGHCPCCAPVMPPLPLNLSAPSPALRISNCQWFPCSANALKAKRKLKSLQTPGPARTGFHDLPALSTPALHLVPKKQVQYYPRAFALAVPLNPLRSSLMHCLPREVLPKTSDLIRQAPPHLVTGFPHSPAWPTHHSGYSASGFRTTSWPSL